MWGEPVPLDAPGVYLIALTNQIERLDATLPAAPIGWERVNTLLARRPELTLDGERPSPWALRTRISGFWLPDETVLYVGMTTLSVRQRVRAFDRTELGAARPHAGGWFLKLLGYDKFFVHYAANRDPESAEQRMLAGFASRVSDPSRQHIFDPDRVMPFANLEYPKGTRKRHGIRGATGPLGPNPPTIGSREAPPPHRPASSTRPERPRAPSERITAAKWPPPSPHPYLTQRVTEADLAAGRIRIPIGATKDLFPIEPGEIDIELAGRRITVRWDPRLGPDRERSGVIGLPKALLTDLVPADTRLHIEPVSGHAFRLPLP